MRLKIDPKPTGSLICCHTEEKKEMRLHIRQHLIQLINAKTAHTHRIVTLAIDLHCKNRLDISQS